MYTNSRGGRSAEGRIGYRGPLARGGDAPRIKLDLTSDERMVREAVRRSVHHPYSDRPDDGIEVSTYSFEELYAEKLRALAERLRPRDLYDVIHLFRRQELNPDRAIVIEILREKCAFKAIPVPTVESIRGSPLVAELPVLEVASAGALDRTWRAPRMATSWRSFGTSAPIEVVRFAAANRLCVELDYQDESDRRSVRTIEPYSLRRSSAGNLLLFAVRSDSGQSRSYRVDRMIGAHASQRSFVPKFVIELSGSGPIVAPTLERPTSTIGRKR